MSVEMKRNENKHFLSIRFDDGKTENRRKSLKNTPLFVWELSIVYMGIEWEWNVEMEEWMNGKLENWNEK